MNLSYRPTENRDLTACARLLEGGHWYDAEMRVLLPKIWSELLRSGRAISGVVEDQDGFPENRIVAFGTTVFVTDAFVEEMKTHLTPPISSHLLKRVLHGASPVLTRSEICAANSGEGLNILVLANGYLKPFWQDTEGLSILEQSVASFLTAHAGYNIKEYLLECWGTSYVALVLAAGFQLRTDFRDCCDSDTFLEMLPELRPSLIGLTRKEALAAPGSRTTPMFLYTPPRFFFHPSEQELLGRALLGGTSEEIAVSLSISLAAVKKRWEAIYARVDTVDTPRLFAGMENEGLEQKRGAQKKDVLLSYLRHHPEELRPYRS